jgi:hypothetical protein
MNIDQNNDLLNSIAIDKRYIWNCFIFSNQNLTIMGVSYRISHGLWCDMIFIQRVVWFLSSSLGELDENHITSQNMGDSFYHIFTTNILILYTLFFGLCGVGIHNVISKNYHMSVITLISRKICDKLCNANGSCFGGKVYKPTNVVNSSW